MPGANAHEDRREREDDYRSSHLDRGEDYDLAIDSAAFDAYMAGRERELLLEIVPRRFPDGVRRYLDFACGTGRVTAVVAPLSDHAVGVDVSASMLERAREKCPNTEFVLHDLTREPLAMAPFDLVTAFRFLGNAEPALRADALRALHELLAPGGFLVVNNHRNPASLHNRLLRLRQTGDDRGLTYPGLRTLLERTGFEVDRVYGIGAWVMRYAWRTTRVLESRWARRLDRITRSRYAVRLSQDMVVVARRR